MREMIIIIISAVLINNIILSQFLGVCPFLGVSKKLSSAIGMGIAVTFVLTIASLITWVVQTLILTTLHLEYLQTIAFILIIASLVQFVEMVMRKKTPELYEALGVYLPLITTNCAVLGVAILNIQKSYGFAQTLANSLGNALGFTLALILFAGIRERLEFSEVPQSLKGMPIALITAALMSIAFLGFTGLL